MATDPLTTILAQLTAIDTASAAARALLTAPVSPVPAPVSPPSPVILSGGLSGVQLLGDDFSGYGGQTANLLAKMTSNIGGTGSPATALYNDGGNASLASVDPTVLYNGHPTMKYTMPGGSASSPELWPSLPSPIDHLWFRAKIRFSPGFTTTGTTSGEANAYKLLGWSHTGYDGSGRVEITNTTQYQLYWNVQSKSGGALVGGGTYGLAGGITTEWSSGAWFDYIIEVDRLGGIIRTWITLDGQTPVLRTTVSETMLNGTQMPQLAGVMLGMNFNQTRAPAQNQALWYGLWECVDGVKHSNPYGL